jgi:superfamily II DNA or RNA helicase
MRVSISNVFTELIDLTELERKKLKAHLTFEGSNLLFERDDSTWVYTGLLDYLQELGLILENYERPIEPLDTIETQHGNYELRDYQILAVKKAVTLTRGIIEIGTGGGKTLIIAAVIDYYRKRGIDRVTIIVPSGALMDQMVTMLGKYGIDDVSAVGYGQQYKKARVQVIIANSAAKAVSRSRRDELKRHINNSEVIISDEAHHNPCKVWVKINEACNAAYRFAFTATAFEDPSSRNMQYRDLALMGVSGPLILQVGSKELRDRGYLAEPIVTIIPVHSGAITNIWHPRAVYKIGIVKNRKRNDRIVHLAHVMAKYGYKILIFVNYKQHGDAIASMLSREYGTESMFITGGLNTALYKRSGSVRNAKMSMQEIARYVSEEDGCVLLATNLLDEGADLPELNVAIMAAGLKKYRRYVQRVGRLIRPKGDSNRSFIYDFFDHSHKYLIEHSQYRMNTYAEEEFTFSSSLAETEHMMGIKDSL